jgi:hypothetical protein
MLFVNSSCYIKNYLGLTKKHIHNLYISILCVILIDSCWLKCKYFVYLLKKTSHYISEKHVSIKDFKTDLLDDNQWVIPYPIVPWETFSNLYISLINIKQGRPGISQRIVLGYLIITYFEDLSMKKQYKLSKKTSKCSSLLDYKTSKPKNVLTHPCL